ncbi:AraC family transcriptional regulator [Tomitella biformata]|uniref:AraC family transcriptional regulator n=1 Tax=Tomitella biformata TaxID=630403 RepID=UPI000463A9C0|nr:AraC family transcriptional regulator [Tomitella biformata]
MADLVRASSLVNVPQLIAAHGGDPDALISDAGVDPAIVGDYNRFITYTALATVVGSAAESLRVPDFGLRVSRLQSLDMLGPIAVLARNAGSVEKALLGVIKYLHIYSPAIEAGLRSSARESQFTFAITVRRLPYRGHMIELCLGVILGMFELLTDSGFCPNRITFRHSRISDEEVYLDYFRCPVQFDAEEDSLVFPTGVLSRSIRGGDTQAHALASRYLGTQHRHLDIDQQVFELVDKLTPIGRGNIVDVADELMLHPRVLQRQLASAGTTFEILLDDWRRGLSEQLLESLHISVGEIAQQLGYSEQSTLSRSCRRWFGKPPLAVRRGLQEAARPSGPTL